MIAGHPVSFAASEKAPISLRYSDVWCGDNNATLVGYFDMIYFNSVIPYGSRVFVHYGFELSSRSPRSGKFEVTETWVDPSKIEMKQWEEYGWFTRIPRNIQTRHGSQKVTAVNFYLWIETPDGRTIYQRGGNDVSNYFRGTVPAPTCEDLGHEALKICAVSLEVASNP